MVIFKPPVRINGVVELGPYTFKDNKGNVIDLTSDFIATSVVCWVKFVGSLATSATGAIVDAVNGQVHIASYEGVDDDGVWEYQFCCLNTAGKKLWGEPVRFTAVINEEDAAAADILDV